MERMQISLNGIESTMLQLGFEGEQNHTRVIIYCTTMFGEYPNAVASMVIKPPTGNIYPKALVRDGVKLIWDASSADCAIAGTGQYQLTFVDGEEIIKTYIGSYIVNPSIVANGEAPDPIEDWIVNANEVLGEAASGATVTRLTNEWLEEHITNPDSPPLDRTLTSSVSAAPADMVGEINNGKAPAIMETASGAIASFADGADNLPVKTLTVGIEPVQDLHGYDNPWPAGGGVNKLPSIAKITETQNGITFVCDGDGSCSFSGTTTKQTVFSYTIPAVTLPEKVYVHLFNSNGYEVNRPIIYFYYDSVPVDFVGLSVTDRIYNGTSAMAGKTINIFKLMVPSDFSGTCTFKLYISESNAIENFAPYSNICPITGWTGAKVTRTGKNLMNLNRTLGDPVPKDISDKTSPRVFDTTKFYKGARSDNYYYSGYIRTTIEDGTVTVTLTGANNSYGVGFPVDVIGGGTYTFSANFTNGYVSFGYYDSSWNYIRDSGAFERNATITVPSEAAYMLIVLRTNAVGATTTFTNIQLELGSVASPYEEYQGETYDITFPSSAGTVYGGTLTVNDDGSGELVVDRFEHTFTGNESFATNVAWGQYSFLYDTGTQIKSSYTTKTSCKSSHFTVCDGGSWSDLAPNQFMVASSTYIGLGYDGTKEELKAWLAAQSSGNTPVQVMCMLNASTEYELTALDVIATLKGSNNIWADTGDTTAEYPCDTKLYIDNKFVELQALILENINNA